MHNTTETYKKMAGWGMLFSSAATIVLTYICYYIFFDKLKLTHIIGDDIVYKIVKNGVWGLVFAKMIITGMLGSSLLMYSPKETTEDPDKKKTFGVLTLIFALFYILLPLVDMQNIIFIIINIFLFFATMFCGVQYKQRTMKDLKDDRKEIDERQWDQTRALVENEDSVNIAYNYWYKGQKSVSWINIINVFRAILVAGSPGSGKTFAVIEEFLRQLIKKRFTGVVYDFKFPTLTVKTYNYLKWYEKNYTIPPKFYYINFDDPEYSHRVNPINEDFMLTTSDAYESTFVLMNNLNKTWVQKEGDFFTDSAMVYTAMLMWYLKLLVRKHDLSVCTIPHMITLTTFESTELLFLILSQYDELRPFMKPFAEALEKGALEQLAGQVSSAGIALAKMTSPEIFYVLSGNDFDFNLNNPISPKILCLGNNPDRQMAYRAPIGLMLSRLTRALNKQKRERSFYCIDEFPTVFMGEIANFIATVRSNKSATLLGFQSFAQIVKNYGKENSDEVIKTPGSRIVGQLLDDDAEMISKNLGKQKVVRKGTSLTSSGELTESENISMEDLVPPEYITQFSQGTFAGFCADTFKDKDPSKAFYGDIIVDLDIKAKEETIPLPKTTRFITDEKLQEETDKFLLAYKDVIIKIENFVPTVDFQNWLNVFEHTITLRKLNEELAKRMECSYEILKKVDGIINLKHRIGLYIEQEKRNLEDKLFKDNFNVEEGNRKSEEEIKQEALTEFRNKTIPKESVADLLYEWIQEGISNREKQAYLDYHYKSLYNDMYALIALEIEDLGIMEQCEGDKKILVTLKNNFQKLSNSDKVNDPNIKDKYKEYYNTAQRMLEAPLK